MSALSYRGIVLPAGAVLQSTTSQPTFKDGERVGDLVTLTVEMPAGKTEPQTAFGEILERLERIEQAMRPPIVWKYEAGNAASLNEVQEAAKAYDGPIVLMPTMTMFGDSALAERTRILSLLSNMAEASESAAVKAALKLAAQRIEETP